MSKEYLDRKKIRKIMRNFAHDCGGTSILISLEDKYITQICQLRPKNQVVIAEGKIIPKFVSDVIFWHLKNESKKGKLIFIEDK